MPDLDEQLANLVSLGGGAALEKFEAELRAVLANVRDPNTEAEDMRKITLTFTFKPNRDREVVAVEISAKSSMAAMRPTGDFMFLGSKEGQVVATVVRNGEDPRQHQLKLEKDKPPQQRSTADGK